MSARQGSLLVSPVSSAATTAGLYQVDLDLTPQYQVLGGLDVIYEKKGGFARNKPMGAKAGTVVRWSLSPGLVGVYSRRD